MILITLASFAFVACSLGVSMGGRVHLVAPHNAIRLGEYLGLSLVLSALAMGTCLVIGLTLLPMVDIHLAAADMAIFALLGAAFLLQKMLDEGLIAHGLPVEAAVIESGSLAGLLVVAGVLTVADRHDVRAYLLAFVFTTLVHLLLAHVRLRRIEPSLRPSYSATSWRRLVRTGFPGIGFAISQLLTFRIDRYLIAIFLSPAAVGIYSVAATAPEFVRLAPMALAQPVVYRLASGSAEIADFRRARFLCLLATVALIAISAAVAPFVVGIFFGEEFAGAVTPLRILLLAEIGMAVFSIDGAALLGKGRVADMALASMVGLVLVASADLLLIPKYGLAGAGWASVLGYSVMGAATMALVARNRRRHPMSSTAATTKGTLPEHSRP